ncbi:MAG: pyridoxamine 5'-phosphate oxidase family protein [Candidatus Pacebacteria bacterium]|nr:pyridoxamine 5'-phosphate oxidase family protein [Candidatus Paceibacterota bacterium]
MKITKNIQKIIESNPIALATIKDKNPYVIAVSCCKIIDNNKILITDNFMTRTTKNITFNPEVALVVWDKRWNGYQLLGTAKYYRKGKWLGYVKKLKENKNLPAKGAIIIKVERIIKSK